jgi:hypothetical protein
MLMMTPRSLSNERREEQEAELAELARQRKIVAAQVEQLVALVEAKDREVARVHAENERDVDEGVAHAMALKNGIALSAVARGHLSDQISQSLQSVRNDAEAILGKEWGELAEIETSMERLADEKIAELQGSMSDEAEVEVQSARYTDAISDEICHLYQNIDQATKYRLELGQKLASAVRYKLDEIHEALAAEQRTRLDSEATLLGLFGEMGQKINQEMEACRRERHMSADRFIGVMETVLPRMQKTRTDSVKACALDLTTSDAGTMAQTASKNLSRKRASVQGAMGIFKGHVGDAA